MRTIAHVSDLHFGAEVPEVARGLVEDLLERKPDVVAVSGDLTQRARRRQFAAAREFLERLPFPRVVVPGNHDIPLYDVARRFVRPLDRWRRYISHDLSPLYRDRELAVLGVNTARSLTFKSGRISLVQMAQIRRELGELGEDVFKVVVAHHPFAPGVGPSATALVGRVDLALDALQASGVELVLTGHLHVGHAGDAREHHAELERSILLAHAGTAVSARGRGEPNAYNWIQIDPPDLAIEVRSWTGSEFAPSRTLRFSRLAHGWRPRDSE